MATYTGSSATSPRRRTLMAASAAAMTLGTIVGLGAWQIGLYKGSVRVAAPPQHREAAIQQSNTQLSPRWVTAAAATGAHGPTTIYMVNTAEQERTLRTWLAQVSFGVPGGAPTNAVVIRRPSAEEEALAQAAQLERLSAAGATTATVVDVQTSP